MGDPAQDKDFLAAPSDQQHAYLMATDKDYSAAKPAEQQSYLHHVNSTNPLVTGAGMEHPPSSAVPEGLKAETGRREEPHVKQQIAALGPAEYAREAPERQAAGKAAIGGEMSLAGAGLTLADLGIIPGLKVLAGGALGSEAGALPSRSSGANLTPAT